MYGPNQRLLVDSDDREATPKVDWKALATQYHHLRMRRAHSNNRLMNPFDGANYLLMGLGAAVGKVLTQAKRLFGGDADADTKGYADALASVRIYTEQLARESRIDLDKACEDHMQKVLNRMDKRD